MNVLLDKPKEIRKIDQSNMLDDLINMSNFCTDAIQIAKQVSIIRKVCPTNIVIIGMGGSAIGGEILKDWLSDRLSIQIDVCRDYVLPAFVNKDTLIFVNSYSGNTEETLTAFLTAIQRKCTIIALTSGGYLAKFCKKLGIPFVLIPSGLQPRVALPYLFFPIPILLSKLGILSNKENELQATIDVIKKVSEANSLSIPTEKNKSKSLAREIIGKIPVIYGHRQYNSIAYRIKTQFNENSKIPSKFGSFPELNHNEIVGYETSQKLNKHHTIILIRDPEEPPEIKNRIETTKSLVFRHANNLLEITAEGKYKLAKMFSVLILGDLTSFYLAILQRKDPTPVKNIDDLKTELAKKSGIKEKLDLELAKII